MDYGKLTIKQAFNRVRRTQKLLIILMAIILMRDIFRKKKIEKGG